MTPRMSQVLEYVRTNGEARCKDIAENFGLSMETAGVYLRNLRHLGHVDCDGYGNAAKWKPCDAQKPVYVVRYLTR